MTRLAAKTALVTGASRGIGRAIAQRSAADGAAIAIHYCADEAAARETVEPDAVDALRFERLVGALALWRGAAMQNAGLQDCAAFEAAVTRLERLRLTAMEDRFDAEISLGHGAELVAELADLVVAHPVPERRPG